MFTKANFNSARLLCFLLLAALVAGCVAPSGLSYRGPQVYSVGTPISPLDPVVTGVVTRFSVSPALPPGLVLNPATGQITGVPSAASAQSIYTVTASNAKGSTSHGLTITVVGTSVSALIGPAGGTVTGPDGVQVIIPAGALREPTTIAIARSSAGAPALPQEILPAGSIYEFTPHDLVFEQPVTLRLPVPQGAVSSEVLMASPGAGWEIVEATPSAGFTEWQRNSFSWGYVPLACSFSPGSGDPYPCVLPRGFAIASASPSAAISRIVNTGFAGLASGSAGAWQINQAGTVSLTLSYTAAPDCGVGGSALSGQVKLERWNPQVPAGAQVQRTTLFDSVVALTAVPVTLPPGVATSGGGGATLRGQGSTTIDVSAHLGDAVNVFRFSFACGRPGRQPSTGSDLITIRGPLPAPTATYPVGGTVSGLSGNGLVLRNNGADDLPVSASGAFSFTTRVNPGAPYNVTVATQPAGQTCSVQDGSGSAAGPVTSVRVNCAVVISTVTLGGTVTGLTGSGLVLLNNGGDNRSIAANGTFTFATPVNVGSLYAVTVASQPTGQACVVQNGTGTASATVANVLVTCAAVAARSLNDTGVTSSQCFSQGVGSCLAAEATSLSNTQDGMIGRDADPATNTGTDGNLGFSFTKIGATGQALAASDTAWSCVRDNVTGLVWEVKTNDGGLRDWTRRYSNYDSTTQVQDGGAPVTQAVIDAPTNSIGFVNAVNATGLCGFNDWRMPTSAELSGLVDYGVYEPVPVLDPAWFPNTRTTNGQARYFTSSPVLSNGASLGVLFDEFGQVAGTVASSGRQSWYVRLVRGAPTTPSFRYSPDGQEATDLTTGLTWRRCPEGMTWNGSACAGVATIFSLNGAMLHAAARAASTGQAWRLPNIKELSSIANPANDPAGFPSASPPFVLWSSTPQNNLAGNAWVGPSTGEVDVNNGFASVRLVR